MTSEIFLSAGHSEKRMIKRKFHLLYFEFTLRHLLQSNPYLIGGTDPTYDAL